MGEKLRVGINGRSMGGNIRDGIANVATNLFLNFPESADIEWVIFSPHENLFPEIEGKKALTHVHPRKEENVGAWFYSSLIHDLHRFPVDVFWSPNQILPPFIPLCTKIIMTVHDFTYIKYPETMGILSRWNLRWRGLSSMRRADILVAVSETTASDLRVLVGGKADIRVIPNGIEPKVFYPEVTSGNILPGLDRPDYFLTVGSIEPRKNLGVVMDAYEVLFEETGGDCPKWVVVFSNTWGSETLLNRMREGKAAKGILMKHNATVDELRRLYSNAIALVFPSLYEGFGLPLVEAMACGCPVIASDIPACREVCQNVAGYFNPLSKWEIVRLIEKCRNNEVGIQIKRNYGYSRASFLGWEKLGLEYGKVISCLLQVQ
jgi:glycosyltransferase involved in cell wall biosynthesis